MRLPKKDELLAIYDSGEGVKWSSSAYWTGEEFSSDRAMIVGIGVGSVDDSMKETLGNVRCRNIR